MTTANTLSHRLSVFAGDIKISHTVFALPWAMLSMVLAGHRSPAGLTATTIALILACMFTARTVAMCANRLLDARLDALNPRTACRAIPSGALPAQFFLAALVTCAAGFVIACWGFRLVNGNAWPLILSPLVLLFVCAYPLLKRFTRLCHYYLGAALALAPLCAWIAILGRLDLAPLLMSAAVLFWTAGFDIIYACQDYQADRDQGLFSVPSKLGIPRALFVSRATHTLCVAALILLGLTTPEFALLYWLAVALAIALLATEHTLVRPTDLSKVGHAFFTINGIISVLIGLLGIADILRR
jgi:4-hydroxybenzoate polyprenyltransferase